MSHGKLLLFCRKICMPKDWWEEADARSTSQFCSKIKLNFLFPNFEPVEYQMPCKLCR